MVKEYLVNNYGDEMVTSGGLRVTTTLDWPMQQIAEKAIREGADRNTTLYDGKNAALVAEKNELSHRAIALKKLRQRFCVPD